MSAAKVHLTTPTGPAACGFAIHVGMTTTRRLQDVTCLACQATHVEAVRTGAGEGATGQGSTDVHLVNKPLSQILTFWRPGSHDWTWKEEFADLIDHPVTEEIRRRVDAEGFGFIDHLAPVMLGSDGRVWDGHHRICLAIEQGHDRLMVEVVEPGMGPAAAAARAWDEGYRRACADHRGYSSCNTGDHGQRNVNPYSRPGGDRRG